MGRRSTLDITRLVSELRKVPGALEGGLGPWIEGEGRGFVREIVKWTPPGNKNALGHAAKKQGEAAVDRAAGASGEEEVQPPPRAPARPTILSAIPSAATV